MLFITVASAAEFDMEQVVDDTKFLNDLSRQVISKIQDQTAEPEVKNNLNDLKNNLSKICFGVVRTKNFIENKTKILLFEYPEAVVFDFFIRTVKYAVIYPWMIQTGFGAYIAAAEIIPEAGLLTIPYILSKIKIKKMQLTSQLGVDPKLLKSTVFPNLDLNINHLHIKEVDNKIVIFPLTQEAAKSDEKWLTILDLENLVPQHFVSEVQKLGFDKYTYEAILLEKAFENTESKKILFSKFSYDKSSEDKNSIYFYNSIELHIKSLRQKLDVDQPSLLKDGFEKWIRGQFVAYKIRNLANKIRYFQLRHLADRLNNNSKIEPKDWRELENFKKESQENFLELRALKGIKLKLSCTALFI